MKLTFGPRLFAMLLDTPGDPGAGGGGAPAASAFPPSPTPVPASGTPSPTPSPVAGTPAPGATPTPQYVYGEDRSGYFSPTDVGKIVLARQEAERRAEQLQRMFEAGTNLRLPKPQTPEQQQQEQLKEQFFSMFPEVKEAVEMAKRRADYDKMLSAAPRYEQGYQQIEERRGAQAIEMLSDKFGALLGYKSGADVDPEARNEIGQMFVNWLQADQGRTTDYGNGKAEQLITTFLAGWSKRYLDPMRRVAQAPMAAAGARGAGLPSVPKPSQFAPKTTPPPPAGSDDEIHGRAWDAFKQAAGL